MRRLPARDSRWRSWLSEEASSGAVRFQEANRSRSAKRSGWLHDGLLMPLAIGVGVLIGRFVPVAAQAVVRVAAHLSAILIVALPFVLGFGRRPDDPSALPLDYGQGLAAVWLGAGAVQVTRQLTRWPSTDPSAAADGAD